MIYSRNALGAGNQGFSFVGAVASAGEQIARVRITSGVNTIVANGQLGNAVDDIVVMDDFLFATPTAVTATPEPVTLSALVFAGVVLGVVRRRGK